MLWESCSSSYTKNHKIEFAIFGFFYDFIGILQVAAKILKGVKIQFAKGTLELFNRSQTGP
jgi:hypothetical protein